MQLDGDKVLVRFSAEGVRLGDQTEAAIKTRTLLGSKELEIRPRGDRELRPDEIIDVSHTTTPYLLPDSLGDLSTAISGLNTDDLSKSLDVLSQSLNSARPDLAAALDGVSRLSDSVASRDQLLRSLLGHASGVTGVLAKRSDQINRLVVDGNSLFGALDARRAAISVLLTRLSAVSDQLRSLVAENRQQLGPTLQRFNSVLDLLDKRKTDIQKALVPLSQYALSLGETVSSGPFFKAYVGNLLPGQYLQPFIDAAFGQAGVKPGILGGPTYPEKGGYNSPPGTVPPTDTAPGPNTPVPPAPPPPFPTIPGLTAPGGR
jgi:phospholipid/cholesterol/gamma-HCH transport system substrate-binding protein